MSVVSAAAPSLGPRVNVVAFVDATDRSQDLDFLADLPRFDQFTKSTPATVEATVWHHGTSAMQRVGWGAAKLFGGLIAAPVLAASLVTVSPLLGGVAIAGVAGLLLADALNIGRMSRLGQAANELKNGIASIGMPAWKGRRTFEIDAGARTTAERLPAKLHPESSDVQQGLIRSFERYPSARHVVYFSGHGVCDKWSSVRHGPLATAFTEASQKTGQRADIVLMSSCLQGTLTAMSALSGGADVAVASEDVLVSGAFPVKPLLRAAAQTETAPKDAARQMVDIMARAGGATAIAVDLKKMPAVTAALDALGQQLIQELSKSGRRDVVKTALDGADALPNLPLARGLRSSMYTRDLGQFLDALQTSSLAPATREAAAHARAAIADATLSTAGYAIEKDQLSGLSFDTRPAAIAPDQPLHLWTEAIRQLA